MRYYRFILIFLFTLFISNNLNSKPVPPGAGEGDVKANILILLDSSDSMKNDVGTSDESLEWVNGAEYAPDGKIIILAINAAKVEYAKQLNHLYIFDVSLIFSELKTPRNLER